MKNISSLRNQIDKVDQKILDLLKKRFYLAKEIGKYKKEKGLLIKDSLREKEIMDKKIGVYKKIWKLIIKESKRIQK